MKKTGVVKVRPGDKLDSGFVGMLNAELDAVLRKIKADPSRMSVAASPGLAWNLSPADLEGLDILNVLRRELLKILARDPITPADYHNMLEVVAAVVRYA